jgi:hypothetical protein
MTTPTTKESKEPTAPRGLEFDPGHVMTREYYERLAREAASQK